MMQSPRCVRPTGLAGLGLLLLAAACSSSFADPGPSKSNGEPNATSPSEGSNEETAETSAPDDGGVVEEASITLDDASYITGPTVDGGANACGMCDREWVCNDMKQLWLSESDGRCVNQKNRTALRCDGILDGSGSPNVGTWTGNDDELQLRFNSLGTTKVIYCLPPT